MKHTDQLLKTQDYSRFVYHHNQQPISRAHVQKISESMRTYGFLPSKPIQVCKDGARLIVVDGHHRLEAATLLRIPIYYVVEPEEHLSLIGDVNVTVRKWSLTSFIKLYAEQGDSHYAVLLEYINKGIPPTYAISLLSGNSAVNHRITSVVQSGKFRVKATKAIDWILGIVDGAKDVAPNIAKRSYIEALSALWFVDDLDKSQLLQKIRNMPKGIIAAADRAQALECLQEVYNFRRAIKINIAFLAVEKMKERKFYGDRSKQGE
jgi:hypothetical protein